MQTAEAPVVSPEQCRDLHTLCCDLIREVAAGNVPLQRAFQAINELILFGNSHESEIVALGQDEQENGVVVCRDQGGMCSVCARRFGDGETVCGGKHQIGQKYIRLQC